MRPHLLALTLTLCAAAAILTLVTPATAAASSYMEGVCAITAEVTGVKPAADGKTDLTIRVQAATEQTPDSIPPGCVLSVGDTATAAVTLPAGVNVVAGEVVQLKLRDIHIYPTPKPGTPRQSHHSQEWDFIAKGGAAAAPACLRLALHVNGAPVTGGKVTLKRGEEVTLTPVAYNDSDQKVRLTYDVPCPAGETVRWSLNGTEGALRGGCNAGVCAEPTSPASVTVPPKGDAPLGKKTFRLGKNTCYEIPEGTVTLSFDTTPASGGVSCGPAPAIQIEQTP